MTALKTQIPVPNKI